MRMSAIHFIAVGVVTTFVCGCQSPSPVVARVAPTPPDAPAPRAVALPTFGTPTPDSIRVTIVGYSVKRPGYYYLTQGTKVRGAMQAAQFSGFVGWQRPYSGIDRQRPDGSVETIWFTFEGRAEDE